MRLKQNRENEAWNNIALSWHPFFSETIKFDIDEHFFAYAYDTAALTNIYLILIMIKIIEFYIIRYELI